MSITRDRELTDLLYASVTSLAQLQADLNALNGHIEGQTHALVVTENKPAHAVEEPHHGGHDKTPEESPEIKALADALKKINVLHRHQEQIIKLLIQNHTDASSIRNEFEKIRTAKLLSSETFALAHLISTAQK